MKITSTPDLLIIDSRPWVIAIALVGGIFGLLIWMVMLVLDGLYLKALIPLASIAFLGLFVWIFVRRNQLILNGADNTMVHRRRTLTRYRQTEYALAHLAKATVDTSHTKNGTPTHRMVLHISGGMDQGEFPFTMGYVSGRGAKRAAQAVNDWLANWRAPGA